MRRLVSPVLVARGDELALLRAAAERAAAGGPAAVLIGGEAGVGKTRLVSEATAAFEAGGFLLLTGACVELGGEALAFAPLVDAARGLARALEPYDLDEALGAARPMLARLLPELEADGSPAVDVQPARLFELVLGVLGRLAAERPVALVVEDLHWGDRDTRDLLAFLVRALRDVRVLLVATYRSDELQRGHPLRRLLAELERVRSVERLELRRFSRDEVAEQLLAIRGEQTPAPVVDLVYERSEGNAFLVEEMLAVVESGGGEVVPPSLSDVLLARLDGLSEPAQRVLRAAAAAGGRVSEGLLAAVVGLPEPGLLQALREAVENHLLVVDDTGTGYRFRHALARDAVYEDMLPGERVRLHAAFGAAIETDPALAGADAVAAALAWHWYAALDLPRALEASVRAGRDATAAWLPTEASRHFERALELWERVPQAEDLTGVDHLGLLELALQAAIDATDEPRALTHAAEALAEVDREREPRRAALVLFRRADALRRLRRDAVPDLETALALLGDEPTRELAAVLAGLANAHVVASADEEARDYGQRAVDVARAIGAPDLEAAALLSLGGARGYLGDFDACIADIRAGLALATELRDFDASIRAYANLSDTLALAGRYEEAVEEAAAGVALARSVGLAHGLGAFLAGNQAEPLLRLGRLDEAEAVLDEALAQAAGPSALASPLLVKAELTVSRGRLDEARELLATARAVLGEAPPHQYQGHLCWIEAELSRQDGDVPAARRSVDRGIGAGTESLARYTWPLVALGLRVENESDEPDAARIDRLGTLAGGLDVLTPSARAFRALTGAETARAGGADDPAAWSAAVEGWRAAREPVPLGYALVRLGAALADRDERDGAGQAVAEGAELARSIGAEPLLAEAEALARRARLAVATANGRPASDDRFGLTDRELDVLRLVAAGRSNSEIGTAL
ncbi:MAG TPA: AAA family ATPase, partial [Gaiellaceae bacterium]|nr:AAA family ATPase [Gaiellaceae bacterium]